jgi:hypothetical protein
MRMRLLLLLTGLLWACSDSKGKEPNDSGHDHPEHTHDAGHTHDASDMHDADGEQPDEDGAVDTPISPLGERPPGSLPRPPGEKLPADLKPPGFGG